MMDMDLPEEIFNFEPMDIDYTITDRENAQDEYHPRDRVTEDLTEKMRKLSIDDYRELYEEPDCLSEEQRLKRKRKIGCSPNSQVRLGKDDKYDRPRKIRKLNDCHEYDGSRNIWESNDCEYKHNFEFLNSFFN